MVVHNVIFSCMLVYEWEARRGWTTGGRIMAASVILRSFSKWEEGG